MRLLLGVSLLLSALATQAQAFGTINGLGQSAEHEKITRLALRPFMLGPKTLSEIAGRRGHFGAVGAPDNPARGLLMTAAAHCDGGDHLDVPGYPQSQAAAANKLRTCRRWIFGHIRQAVVEAGGLVGPDGRIRDSQIPTIVSCTYNGSRGRAKCNVLEALGLAFHAAQDFYSHTNWVGIPARAPIGLANPPGLGHRNPAPWLDPTRHEAFPRGLMSGCFEGVPESHFCKTQVRHAILNKDTGAIDLARGVIGAGTTPRGRIDGNFARAVRAAVADTRAKWRYFEAQVIARYGPQRGQRIVCVMRQDVPAGC